MNSAAAKIESRTLHVAPQTTVTQPIAVPDFSKGIGRTVRMVLGDRHTAPKSGVPFVRLNVHPSGLVTLRQKRAHQLYDGKDEEVTTGRLQPNHGAFSANDIFSVSVQQGDNGAFSLCVTNNGKTAGRVALMDLGATMDCVELEKGDEFLTRVTPDSGVILFRDRTSGDEIGKLDSYATVISPDGQIKSHLLDRRPFELDDTGLSICRLDKIFSFSAKEWSAWVQVVNNSADRVVRAVFEKKEGYGYGQVEAAKNTTEQQVKAAFARLAESLDIVFNWKEDAAGFTPEQWESIARNMPEITKAFNHVGAERLAYDEYGPDFSESSYKSDRMFDIGGSVSTVYFNPGASSQKIIKQLEGNVSSPKPKPAPKVEDELDKLFRGAYGIPFRTWRDDKEKLDWKAMRENASTMKAALELVGIEEVKGYLLMLDPTSDGKYCKTEKGEDVLCFNPYEKDPAVMAKAILRARQHHEDLNPPQRKIIAAGDINTRNMLPVNCEDAMAKFAFLNQGEGHLRFCEANGSKVKMGGGTEIGGRDMQQDAMLVDPNEEIIMVADGMGGHVHGEIASMVSIFQAYTAVAKANKPLGEVGNAVGTYFWTYLDTYVRKAFPKMFKNIEDAMYRRASPGSTLSLLRRVKGQKRFEGLLIGDSPVYIIDLDSGGFLKPKLQQSKMASNIIENSVRPLKDKYDTELDMPPELVGVNVPQGRRYMGLICSDGVTCVVSDEEIVKIAQEHGELAWRKLIELAKERGSWDNITAAQMILENK